ncbi:MAG: SDR family NAD(P)-dependent oxidoreductase [Microscillaceae bacterium]|nr:SDR family NAD(P)-dependent oxidoreductase [Microscillaceae bacterium]
MSNMSNKFIVVTGATGGIGEEISLLLAKNGYNLILLNRDKAKSESLKQKIKQEYPTIEVDYFLVDLSIPKQIEETVEKISKTYKSIDALINNAGVLFKEKILSESGNDMHFQVNVVAPYLLMELFKPLLMRSQAGSKFPLIVNTSSNAIFMSSALKVDELKNPKKSGIFHSYANSKLALTVMSKRMANLYSSDGIKVFSIDPGGNRTDMTAGEAAPFFVRWFKMFLPPPSKGASYLTAPLLDKDFHASSGALLSSGKIKSIPKKSDTEEKVNDLMKLLKDMTLGK